MYRLAQHLLLTTVLALASIASSCLSRPLPAGERLRRIEIDNISAYWDSNLSTYIEDVSQQPCTLALNAKGRAELIRTEKAIELNDGLNPQQHELQKAIEANRAPPLLVSQEAVEPETAAASTTTASSDSPSTPASPSLPAFTATVAEEQMLAELNDFRARCNPPLPPLTISPYIMSFARAHAQAMASRNSMYHSNFGQENVAYGTTNARDTNNMWINSPGHNANMRTRNTEVGLSVARSANGTYYWVQQFSSGTINRPIATAGHAIVSTATAPVRYFANNFPVRRGLFGRRR